MAIAKMVTRTPVGGAPGGLKRQKAIKFRPAAPTGVLVTIFAIAIAAAEAAVGLALVIGVYRHYRTTNVDQIDQLKG